MNINLKLKAKIIEKYRTQSRFAVACGRQENWVSRLVQGIQLPTEQEKEQIRVKLQISPEDINHYFQVRPTDFNR